MGQGRFNSEERDVMTYTEMRKCIRLAKQFGELYPKTGLVAVSTDSNRDPKLHITEKAFMEIYKDGNYYYKKHGENCVQVRTHDDGVTVFALVDEVPEGVVVYE